MSFIQPYSPNNSAVANKNAINTLSVSSQPINLFKEKKNVNQANCQFPKRIIKYNKFDKQLKQFIDSFVSFSMAQLC